MPFMAAMSRCYTCKRLFSFNADGVPSITPPGMEYADRQPICGTCMREINEKRTEMGLPEIRVRPDAYEAQEVD